MIVVSLVCTDCQLIQQYSTNSLLCAQLPQLDRSCLLDWTPECLQTNPPDICILCLSLCAHALDCQRSFFLFSYDAQSVWNSLPCKVRSSDTSFKSSVKSLQAILLSVCVCVGGGGGGVYYILVLCFVIGYVLQSGEITHKTVHYYYHRRSVCVCVCLSKECFISDLDTVRRNSLFKQGCFVATPFVTRVTNLVRSFCIHDLSVPHDGWQIALKGTRGTWFVTLSSASL